MAPTRRLFSLYTRKSKKGKPTYYVRFKKADGTWASGKCTGLTNRNAAETWAIEYLQGGQVMVRENITFEEFSKDFFSWGGEWATDRLVTGKRVTPRQCKEKTAILNNRLLPVFGKMRLSHVDKPAIKSFRNDLFIKGYAGQTINASLSCLKVILEAAEEKSLIRYMPKIERASIKAESRGILTVEEVRSLFAVEWPDFRCYVMNFAAACTGLRRGELLALQLKQVHGDYIEVVRSWDEVSSSMNETTKTGRSRTVIIPGMLKRKIDRLVDMNPWGKPDSFLFFSSVEWKPMEGGYSLESLYQAIERIGIDEQQRKKRNITFHSWRHWFNSLLINAKVPIQKIQSLTGHLTAEMTQHYYHVDDMVDVLQVVQDTLYEPLPGDPIDGIVN